MNIHVNAFAAFKYPRTGVEEYTHQIIKHLAMLEESRKHRFILYKTQTYTEDDGQTLNNLPENFEIKKLSWPLKGWTQIRLSCEMLKNRGDKDILFTPAHVLPFIHPKNSIVTIHGLEYEYYPEMYPFWHRKYLKWSTKYALKHARKIIAASENTKRDLIKLYNGDPKKIEVVHHGVGSDETTNHKLETNNYKLKTINYPYILYIGRIEKKKNIEGIIKAFGILKKQYQISYKLILAGPAGFGYQEIKKYYDTSEYRSKIEMNRYVSKEEKWGLLKNADVFLFPSFYEGFGFPVLEAQRAGAPVVASNASSFPEILRDSALLVSPQNPEEIAEAIYSVISNKNLRENLIQKGYENIKRFGWEKCARETLRILLDY